MASNFTGRENELKLLEELLNETTINLGKVVFISAEAGFGKSELVHQFLSINKTKNYIAEIQCFSKNMSDAYLPAKDILVQLNADVFAGSEDRKTVYDRLSGIIGQAGPDWISVIPVVGGFVSAGIRTFQATKHHFGKKNDGNGINGPEDIQRLFDNELRKLAKKKPVIVFIDDIQWADPSTLDLIFALSMFQRMTPYALMLICTFRSNEFEKNQELVSLLNNLQSYKRTESQIKRTDKWLIELAIPPFGLTEIGNYILKKFPVNDFPGDFATQLNRISKNNVLFATSVLEYLQDRNEIFLDNDVCYHLKVSSLTNLPETINGIIAERIQKLTNDLREVLDCASVEGEKFSLQILEYITCEKQIKLVKMLNELACKHDLVVSIEPMTIEKILLEIYGFKHSLIHKYVYEKLDINTRKVYHREVAKAMKILLGEEMEKSPELISEYNRHVQIGNGLIDSITYKLSDPEELIKMDQLSLLDAAKQELTKSNHAYEIYAMKESLDHAIKAKEILINTDLTNSRFAKTLYNSLKNIALASKWLGFYNQAENESKRMLEIVEQANLLDFFSNTYNTIGAVLYSAGKYDEAIEWFKKALEIDERNSDSVNIAIRYSNIGAVIGSKGNYDEAIEWFKKALEIDEINKNQLGIINKNNNIGAAYRLKGNYDEAIVWFKKSLNINESTNDNVEMAKSFLYIGLAFEEKGKYDEAIEWYKKALEIDECNNDIVNKSKAFTYIGSAFSEKDKDDEAIEWFKKALKINESNGALANISLNYNYIGSSYCQKDKYDEAIEWHMKALEIDHNINNRQNMAVDYDYIGKAFRAKGMYDEATEWYMKALKINESNGDIVNVGANLNNIGFALKSKGNYDEAVEWYKKSIEIKYSNQDMVGTALCYNNIGDVFELKGKYDEAIEWYKKSLAINENLSDLANAAINFNNIGQACCSKGNYDEGIVWYKQALKINESNKNIIGISLCYNYLGSACDSKGSFDEAIVWYKKVLEIAERNNEKYETVAYSVIIAKLFEKEEDLMNAILYLERSAKINEKLSDDNKIDGIRKNIVRIKKLID